jgi:hypothetical protein
MKWYLPLVAMAVFTSAQVLGAEWTKIASSPIPNTEDYYYEKSSVKMANGRVYVWHLMDYLKGKNPMMGGASVRYLASYNCSDDGTKYRFRYKNLGFVVYSERMAGGTIVRDTTVGVDESVEEDISVDSLSPFLTSARAVSRVVCEGERSGRDRAR